MGEDFLGAALVEAQAERQRIAAGVGDAEHVQHRRNLRFTAGAVQAFGNVEHQVRTESPIGFEGVEIGFDQGDLVA